MTRKPALEIMMALDDDSGLAQPLTMCGRRNEDRSLNGWGCRSSGRARFPHCLTCSTLLRECDRLSPASATLHLDMSAKYAFKKGLKEIRFLFCQTSEHSAATRYPFPLLSMPIYALAHLYLAEPFSPEPTLQ